MTIHGQRKLNGSAVARLCPFRRSADAALYHETPGRSVRCAPSPHPSPLPWGEGAAVSHARLPNAATTLATPLFAESKPTACVSLKRRHVPPLPEGEGRGEGESNKVPCWHPTCIARLNTAGDRRTRKRRHETPKAQLPELPASPLQPPAQSLRILWRSHSPRTSIHRGGNCRAGGDREGIGSEPQSSPVSPRSCQHLGNRSISPDHSHRCIVIVCS